MPSPADGTVIRGTLHPDATRSMHGREGRRCQAATDQVQGQILPYHKKAARLKGRQRNAPANAGPVGQDHRQRVIDSTVFPFSAICALRMFFPDGQYAGTGAFIGSKLVLTAAHNLKNSELGGLASEIHVFPGLNGNLDQPEFPSVIAERKVYTTKWEQEEDDDFDYGVLILPTDLGNEVGWLAVSKYADGDLRGLGVNNASYPRDCPLVSAGNCPEQYTGMYLQHANITRVEPEKLFYADMLMTPGTSGSPLFVYYPDDPPSTRYRILGIHTNAESVDYFATRISDQVYAHVEYWQSLGL
jgi:glutamyl endopeptidase